MMRVVQYNGDGYKFEFIGVFEVFAHPRKLLRVSSCEYPYKLKFETINKYNLKEFVMSSYKRKKTFGDTDWFVHDRFGMFIHFGIYALPARHEWIKNRESISEEKYQKYFDHFDPDMLDCKEWARQAREAGMKYVVMTTKHHDGFCLFDTKYTDYNVMNTPYGKDIIKEYVDAFRAEGLKIGFYYSLIDWHHPDFPIDKHHPRRFDSNAEELDRGRDVRKYARYMRDQVSELMTNYGKIDIMWFDFSYGEMENAPEWMQFGGAKGKDQWEAEELIALTRSFNPDIIINNRTQIPQDIITPEQYEYASFEPPIENGEYITWETCHTFSGSWGYSREERSWKTPKMLIDILVKTVARGGNLIMNVGPNARGYLDDRAENALRTYADWMRYNSRSIYGCTKAEPEFVAPNGTVFTQSEDGKRLYVHLVDYAFYRLNLDIDADRIDYMQLLSDGSELLYEGRNFYGPDGTLTGKYVSVNMSEFAFKDIDPVIEIFLK